MFALTIFFGIYSNLIFMLGITGFLSKTVVIAVTLISIAVFIVIYSKTEKINFKLQKLDKVSKSIILLILAQAIVNFVGVLGPELGFDALWYHLTLPKLFLTYHKILHIPGGLFYYSDMPKLGEMFYVGALSFGNEVLAKFIHYIFGILCLVSIYGVAVKFTSKKYALLACLIFYSNLVVGWESISAYIDLIRTFFEITAFWAFIEWVEKKDEKLLYESAVMLGLAVSTKLIGLGSLLIFSILIFLHLRDNKKNALSSILKYVLIVLFVVSPWLVYSYLNTSNPIYPLFTSYYNSSFNIGLLNPITLIKSLFSIFINSADPINPIYFIFIPLILIKYKNLDKKSYFLFIYAVLGILIWYLTPQTGGGRFLMPYLPVFSIFCVVILATLKEQRKFIIFLIFLFSIVSIGYRALANYKFIPVILGAQSKNIFFAEHLNYSYGDFYDVDGFFDSYLTNRDNVLLYGFHNLYYVEFPYIDSSYVKQGDSFNYVATQNTKLPKRFSNMTLIYSNKLTKVSLYTYGGVTWHY